MSYKYLGQPPEAQAAMYAAAQQSQQAQVAQQKASPLEAAITIARDVARGQTDPKLSSVWFLAAAEAAAAQVVAKRCDTQQMKRAQCQKLGSLVAQEAAQRAEQGRKEGGPTPPPVQPATVTNLQMCNVAKQFLDATYSRVVRQLVSIYYALWPGRKTTIGSSDQLVLPAFTDRNIGVPEMVTSKALVERLAGRVAANGGKMKKDGRNPTARCNYGMDSVENAAASAQSIQTQYNALLRGVQLTVAELIADSVTINAEYALLHPNEVISTAPATPAPAPSQSEEAPPPSESYFAPDSSSAAETNSATSAEAGMLGVGWKWWLIGGVAVGGAWLLLRRR